MDSRLDAILTIIDENIKNFPELKTQGFNWTSSQIKEEFSRAQLEVYKNYQNQTLGFLFFRDNGEALEITLMAIQPKHSRKGFMSDLIARVKAKNPGRTFWLEVHEKNVRAQNFYGKLGFIETGRRIKYYSDGSSAILMSLNNSPGEIKA